MDPSKWIEWAGRATATSLLIGILITGQMGYWTWGTTLNDMKAERDTWKELALKGANLAREATSPHVVGLGPPSLLPTNASVRQVEETLDQVKTAVKPHVTEPDPEDVQ